MTGRPFTPFPGFDPADGEDPRMTLSRDNPVGAPRAKDSTKPGDLYLVWSTLHNQWWRPDCAGYTRNLSDAGQYSRDEAISICAFSRDGWGALLIPPEIPVPLADAIEAAERDAKRRAPR